MELYVKQLPANCLECGNAGCQICFTRDGNFRKGADKHRMSSCPLRDINEYIKEVKGNDRT